MTHLPLLLLMLLSTLTCIALFLFIATSTPEDDVEVNDEVYNQDIINDEPKSFFGI